MKSRVNLIAAAAFLLVAGAAMASDSLHLRCEAVAIRLCEDGVEQCRPWLPGDGSTMSISRVNGVWERSDSEKTTRLTVSSSDDETLNDSYYLFEYNSDGNRSALGLDRLSGMAEEFTEVPDSRETIAVRWKCEALQKKF